MKRLFGVALAAFLATASAFAVDVNATARIDGDGSIDDLNIWFKPVQQLKLSLGSSSIYLPLEFIFYANNNYNYFWLY